MWTVSQAAWAGLLGESLERRYRERAGAYFGRVLRRTRVLDVLALEERLSPEEMHDSLLTDLIVSGKPRTRQDVEEVWFAVEVSSVVATGSSPSRGST